MRRLLRLVNLLAGTVCLASGAAALSSWAVDPGYRARYGDPLWLLVVYVVFYAWVLRSFWRDDAWAPRLALVKAAGAYVFLGAFVAVGPLWMARTPGRYVYQLFYEWGSPSQAVLMAYVLLGRGLWNTVNAMAFTLPWWTRLRADRPILGRLLTTVPLALMVTFVWIYRELVRLERATFSVEATAVAREILEGVDCDAIRGATARTTADLRQRGDRRYEVEIVWDCRDVRVRVRDADGRLGTAREPMVECCDPAPAP